MTRSRLALGLALILFAFPLAAAQAQAEHAEEGGATELVFKWLNFILVFGGLGYLLRQPLQRFFTGQRAAIRNAIEEAHQARVQSRQRLAEVEQRLARLGEEVESIRRRATDHAAAERQRIHEAAQREAARILATAHAEIESATRAARLELRAYSARLAVTLAEQRIQQRLTPEIHAALFQAFVTDLSAPGASTRREAADRERRQ